MSFFFSLVMSALSLLSSGTAPEDAHGGIFTVSQPGDAHGGIFIVKNP